MARARPSISRAGAVGTAVAAIAAALAVSAAFPPSCGDGRSRPRRADASAQPRLELGPGPGDAGFARATLARPFSLPRDHGPHFDFQTEWWYYTGNVVAADGRRFGFQLTFFRRGLSPGPPPEGSSLASNQVYFAHLAVTDVAAGRHAASERFSRGAGGLAGATGEPFAVWLEDWAVESLDAQGAELRLVARDGAAGLSLDLELRATKPLVAHGDRGLSPKGGEPGNASYYVGYTRLLARGELGLEGRVTAAVGEAWFDHEWGTSALGVGGQGWDWFSLQLGDGRELMYFEIRRADGTVEPSSGGTLVERSGASRRLTPEDVTVDVLSRWTSPASRAVYPSRWRLRVPGEGLDLLVAPWTLGQELRTSFTYWEGAVRVSGHASGRPVAGQGYVELTGYARSMQGVF